jgi:hypothetical protein
MDFLMNIWVWVGSAIFFILLCTGLLILYYLIFNKSHVRTELKASMKKVPIGIFFQDNRFLDWKPVQVVNGIVNDEYYGPFFVTNTYVDKRTKNIIIPFDVDMDGDRTSNTIELVKNFKNITTNEKSIDNLRLAITENLVESTPNIKNLTSHIKLSTLKHFFISSTPHNLKSKIEKIIAIRVAKFQNVNPMQAVIVFGAIFGIIVIGAILLKTMGVVD